MGLNNLSCGIMQLHIFPCILKSLFLCFSAPEKQTILFQDCHRVGAFAKNSTDKQSESDDVPFLSLLKQVNKEAVVDSKVLDPGKVAGNVKPDVYKGDTSESALSESKTSTSSQVSAPDDFVMVELVGLINQKQHYDCLVLITLFTLCICQNELSIHVSTIVVFFMDFFFKS